MPDELTSWPSGIRDTTEFPTVSISVDVSLREHLQAFCSLDGIGWNAYDMQGEVGGLTTADSRLRTYRKMYERLGLIYKDEDKIRLSRLGIGIRDLQHNMDAAKEQLLHNLLVSAVDVLARYQLRNPIDGPNLPTECDVQPYLCIWKAMRELDNKLNYEEMNRVILRITSMSQLDIATAKIRDARSLHGTYREISPGDLDTILGEQVHTDQPTARIAPWFSFAGWGGLIIEQQLDEDGYRRLTPASLNVIDAKLANPPAFYNAVDQDDWLRYYIGGECVEPPALAGQGAEHNVLTPPDESQRIPGGTNILLYGVPGSGKSRTIEHEYCGDGVAVDRLVFHPDYTNADFIGQILPIVDEGKQVTYEFSAGPFTAIIRDAYCHPNDKYILVIEEINRGNAPAIFGEVFQLLDRLVEDKTVDGVLYPAGTSEYGVTHRYMAKHIYGDPRHKVRIPSNLSIIGTMNTSDQNVFTLDTAFQRRWRMRLIENNFDNVRLSLANAQILDTEVTWKRFCETVNGLIVGNRAKTASAEDKRLGVYFVHETDLTFDSRALPAGDFPTLLVEYNSLLGAERLCTITDGQKIRLKEIREALIHNRQFPEKVIKYLWDDAFKFNPEVLFDTGGGRMDSLETVIRTFVYSKGHDRFNIFRDTVRKKLYEAH